MDLIATLRSKISSLEEGEYTPGLKATILHIETAFGHLNRGQKQNEETAFTDAIYRTNQAFEGSIKEAYRVLAGKDPAKQRPYDIEKYLEQKAAFRQRVLAQFTNYRTEWRNPSTHDYKLDFDESEAFLAIVSVTAFACLLFDQIAEHLSFQKAKAATDAQKGKLKLSLIKTSDTLIGRTTKLIEEFSKQNQFVNLSNVRTSEIQVIGALAGFLASAAPDIKVTMEPQLAIGNRIVRPDMILSVGDEQVLLEMKGAHTASKMMYNALAQVENYLMVSGIKSGILYFHSGGATTLESTEQPVSALGAKIVILKPTKSEHKSIKLSTKNTN